MNEIEMWLVERTYSDDELNILILEYTTLDGERLYREEKSISLNSDEFDDIEYRKTVEKSNTVKIENEKVIQKYSELAKESKKNYEC